jgi:hypothetical protein
MKDLLVVIVVFSVIAYFAYFREGEAVTVCKEGVCKTVRL